MCIISTRTVKNSLQRPFCLSLFVGRGESTQPQSAWDRKKKSFGFVVWLKICYILACIRMVQFCSYILTNVYLSLSKTAYFQITGNSQNTPLVEPLFTYINGDITTPNLLRYVGSVLPFILNWASTHFKKQLSITTQYPILKDKVFSYLYICIKINEYICIKINSLSILAYHKEQRWGIGISNKFEYIYIYIYTYINIHTYIPSPQDILSTLQTQKS